MKPSPKQRWRVSVYAPTAMSYQDFPIVHKASRKREIAERHFLQFSRQIPEGGIARVILHQGKLHQGNSQYIEDDSTWWKESLSLHLDRLQQKLSKNLTD